MSTALPWALGLSIAIGTFAFLGALELSLRFLRPLWLALLLASVVAQGIGRLSFLLLLHGQLAVHPVDFIDPVIFSAVFWLGLWLLNKRDRRAA